MLFFKKEYNNFFKIKTGLFTIFIGPDEAVKTVITNTLLKSVIKKTFRHQPYFHNRFGDFPEPKGVVSPFLKKNILISSLESKDFYSRSLGLRGAATYLPHYGIEYFLAIFSSIRRKYKQVGLIIINIIKKEIVNGSIW